MIPIGCVIALFLGVGFMCWAIHFRGHPMRPTPKRRTNNDRHPSQGGQE